MNLEALTHRLGGAGARRSIIAVLLSVTVVGCAYDENMLPLLEVAETADQYFHSFDFAWDLAHAVSFAEKVLGSAGP